MKIAFLAPRYHTNQISLVNYLLKVRHKVSFYVVRIAEIEDHSSLKPVLINLSFISKILKLFFFNSNKSLSNYRYGIPSINELLKLKTKKYDLIIIRDPVNLMSLSYLFWAKIIRLRVILYIQREIHRKNSLKIKEMLESMLLKFFKTECISPCLGKLKYKKMNNITYLPFCLNVINYKKKWFTNNKINILTIGKFIKRKNHSLLIQALSLIKKKSNFRVTIIGECSTKEHFLNLDKIKEEIRLSGLDINILTNVSPKKMKGFYKKHDLFVLPSINEPASISNLEAMSLGLPVITTDSNNTSCYTEHNKNGFIVKSNNVNDLSKKLKFFIENRLVLKKFGKESLSIIEKKYNPNIIYKKFIKNISNA